MNRRNFLAMILFVAVVCCKPKSKAPPTMPFVPKDPVAPNPPETSNFGGGISIDRNSFEVRSLALDLERQFLRDHIDADCLTYCPDQFIDDAVEILITKDIIPW